MLDRAPDSAPVRIGEVIAAITESHEKSHGEKWAMKHDNGSICNSAYGSREEALAQGCGIGNDAVRVKWKDGDEYWVDVEFANELRVKYRGEWESLEDFFSKVQRRFQKPGEWVEVTP